MTNIHSVLIGDLDNYQLIPECSDSVTKEHTHLIIVGTHSILGI